MAIAIVHIHFIAKSTQEGNLTFSIASAIIVEQVWLGYSLISATIPNLKSFIMSFDTSLMMDVSHKLAASRGTSGPSEQSSSVQPGSKATENAPRLSDVEAREEFLRRMRPDRVRHTANVEHERRWSMSAGDISLASFGASSQDRIIRRDIHWDVEESFAPGEGNQQMPRQRISSPTEE